MQESQHQFKGFQILSCQEFYLEVEYYHFKSSSG